MQSPREILADLWNSSGGDPTALDTVTLTGEEPQLPSSFRVAAAFYYGSHQTEDVIPDASIGIRQ